MTSADSVEKPRKLVAVVCACIRRNSGKEVLLSLRRTPGVDGLDGKWELPGGKIEFGETPEQAIVREIAEEIGIRVRPLRLLPYLHTNLWEYPHVSQHVILSCFECEPLEIITSRPSDDVRWFRADEIDFRATLPGTEEFVSLAFTNELVSGLYLRFEYVDDSVNAFKQFSLATQPTLYSNYGLVKYWGRIGQWSRVSSEEFTSPKDLDARVLELSKKRLAHGYKIVDVQGPGPRYRVLEEIVDLARSRGGVESQTLGSTATPADNCQIDDAQTEFRFDYDRRSLTRTRSDFAT